MNAFPGLEFRVREQNEKSIAFEQTVDGVAIDDTIGTMGYLDGVALQFRTVFFEPKQVHLPDINVTQSSAEIVSQQSIEGEIAKFLEVISFESLLRYSVNKQEIYWDVRLYLRGDRTASYRVRVNATTSEVKTIPTVINIMANR